MDEKQFGRNTTTGSITIIPKNREATKWRKKSGLNMYVRYAVRSRKNLTLKPCIGRASKIVTSVAVNVAGTAYTPRQINTTMRTEKNLAIKKGVAMKFKIDNGQHPQIQHVGLEELNLRQNAQFAILCAERGIELEFIDYGPSLSSLPVEVVEIFYHGIDSGKIDSKTQEEIKNEQRMVELCKQKKNL